jgi:guanosine-3',5'-bis(diphosphate) 3'-pyrophosphohydrolase
MLRARQAIASRESCEGMLSGIALVCAAAELAAHRHTGQKRKGRECEPYINHLAEVANLLSAATNGEDAELVAAGWLHDTLEDTPTTSEELSRRFGHRVAALVAEVTDDMSLAKGERRDRQIAAAPRKSAAAKLIKIADKISNVRARIFAEASRAQREELADYLAWAEKVVAGCSGVSAALDSLFAEVSATARSTM